MSKQQLIGTHIEAETKREFVEEAWRLRVSQSELLRKLVKQYLKSQVRRLD